LALPAIFSVTGSPVTTAGTLTGTLATQVKNLVWVGPVSGSPAAPTFRQLVAEDLNPTYTNGKVLQTDGSGVLSWVAAGGTGTVTSVGLTLPAIFSVTGSPVTASGTLAATLATQTANLVFASPASGGAAAPTFRQLVAEDLNTTYTNGKVLQTNGAGVLSWVTASGGSPAGSNTYVQYNNAGAFGASSSFTFTTGTGNLAVPVIAASGYATNTASAVITGNQTTTSTCYVSRYTAATITTSGMLAVDCTNDIQANIAFSIYHYRLGGTTDYLTMVRNDGHFVLRGTASSFATAIMEIPWLTGDTLPTMYVGSTSSNRIGIKVDTDSNTGVYVNSNATALYGIGNIAVSGNTYVSGGYAGYFNGNASDSTALYVLSGGGGRTVPMIDILAQANDSSMVIRAWDGATNMFTFDQTGWAKVRTGKQTANKMAVLGGTLYSNTTAVANTGSSATDLMSYSIDANSLGTTGDWIRITAEVELANSIASNTIKCVFGGTEIWTSSSVTPSSVTSYYIQALIIKTGSNTQKCIVWATANASLLQASSRAILTSTSITDTAAITVKFTGTGTASNQISQEIMLIEFGNHYN
jgi:hypothetical protein